MGGNLGSQLAEERAVAEGKPMLLVRVECPCGRVAAIREGDVLPMCASCHDFYRPIPFIEGERLDAESERRRATARAFVAQPMLEQEAVRRILPFYRARRDG